MSLQAKYGKDLAVHFRNIGFALWRGNKVMKTHYGGKE